MMRLMPEMNAEMSEMMALMDADTLVAEFCRSSNFDLAFIDLTIPHHLSAVLVSEEALTRAIHDEIRVFAKRVIEDQQREIALLTAVRSEMFRSATPEVQLG